MASAVASSRGGMDTTPGSVLVTPVAPVMAAKSRESVLAPMQVAVTPVEPGIQAIETPARSSAPVSSRPGDVRSPAASGAGRGAGAGAMQADSDGSASSRSSSQGSVAGTVPSGGAEDGAAAGSAETWTLRSWRERPIRQQPQYPDADALEACLQQVREKPALVEIGEVDSLLGHLKRAAAGEAFLLQGGDCAERFVDCNESAIRRQLKCLWHAAGVLECGLHKPVTVIGRIAGQYAKPRSSNYCMHNGIKVASFRGDNVHAYRVEGPHSRVPQPKRLVQGYFHSAATLNYIRSSWPRGAASAMLSAEDSADATASAADTSAVTSSGSGASTSDSSGSGASTSDSNDAAGLAAVTDDSNDTGTLAAVTGGSDSAVVNAVSSVSPPDAVGARSAVVKSAGCVAPTLPPAASSSEAAALTARGIVQAAGEAGGAMGECVERGWASFAKRAARRRTFVSHEGLHLAYEEALVRVCPSSKRFFAGSAHMVWIGDRTRQLDGAHVEFFRGIANPLGVKLGPSSVPSDVVALLLRLCAGRPVEDASRICLIVRMGWDRAAAQLPAIVDAVVATKLPVVWLCDPMHGNTQKLPSGFKTRDYEHIMQEVRTTSATLAAHGARLGGLHLELTGDTDVTECLGGPCGTLPHDVPRKFRSYCDPRLNYCQTMAVAFGTVAAIQRKNTHARIA